MWSFGVIRGQTFTIIEASQVIAQIQARELSFKKKLLLRSFKAIKGQTFGEKKDRTFSGSNGLVWIFPYFWGTSEKSQFLIGSDYCEKVLRR